MRRICILLVCVLLLTGVVYADSAASSVSANVTVEQTGTAQVSATYTLRLESATDLLLPVGSHVSDVTVNGQSAHLKTVGGVSCVSMEGLYGEFTLTVHYTQSGILTFGADGNPVMNLPLLAGLSLPVEAASFTVTMPGTVEQTPVFLSGYFQESIDSSLTYEVRGNQIIASLTSPLKDHETLTLTVPLPAEMFPVQEEAESPVRSGWIVMGVAFAAAFAYWIAFMRFLPPWKPLRYNPTPRITAGEVGTRLTGVGADLTLMVVSWAQLGYLTIQMNSHGRVLLHRKMDMGNERSKLEAKAFRNLFGKRTTVDASGPRYTRLWEDVAAAAPTNQSDFKRSSGNPALLRMVCIAIGALTGALAANTLIFSGLRVLWMILLGGGFAICAWQIQTSCRYLYGGDYMSMLPGAVCIGIQILLGKFVDQILFAAVAAGLQVLLGVLGAFGGMRTQTGKQAVSDLVGMKRAMRKLSRAELARVMRKNPEYFYQMVPFALALGVDGRFARAFGRQSMPHCAWFISPVDTARTASEFRAVLRKALRIMNEGRRRLPWEQLLPRR